MSALKSTRTGSPSNLNKLSTNNNTPRRMEDPPKPPKEAMKSRNFTLM